MAWMDPLAAHLLDLLFELRRHPVPLMIGGGFGLYLKRMRLDETHDRTLFSQLPMPRATNDLDLFIRADVLCDLESMEVVGFGLFLQALRKQFAGNRVAHLGRLVLNVDELRSPGGIALRAEHLEPQFPHQCPDPLA